MVISYKNVNIKHPDGDDVLTDVTFDVAEGEFVYLTGKVGSGKTSLLKTLYGEMDIASGEATVLDFDMTTLKRRQLPALRRQLGIVFQDFKLLTDRTVSQNLDFVLRATGWKERDRRVQRINEVLEVVELLHKKDVMPYSLSSGEQQRICVARAILNSPKLILADEATGNQDTEASLRTVALLHRLAQQGTAVVMSTHNAMIINQFAGTVYHLSNHQLQQYTVTDEIPDAVVEE
ncbi:MAG: ATP-binding cassette domain-containing protein [Bacteroidaceae bacterium]|nr:ATP-binding cassette domain-containing protein [Bacteroidaceae bacterium]